MFLIFILLLFVSTPLIAQDKVKTLQTGTSVKISITIDPDAYSFIPSHYNHLTPSQKSFGEGMTAEEGLPNMLLRSVLIDIPAEVDSCNVVSLSASTTLSTKYFFPEFRTENNEDFETFSHGVRPGYYPSKPMIATELVRTRSGNKLRVVYFPFQFNGQTTTTKVHSTIEGEIAFFRRSQKILSQTASVISSLSTLDRLGVSVKAVGNGPVILSLDDLRQNGLQIDSVGQMKVTMRGREISIIKLSDGPGGGRFLFISNTDFSDPLQEDEYTDTSLFRIQRTDGVFKTFGGYRQSSAIPSETLRTFIDTLRIQKDSIYYPGGGNLTNQNETGKNEKEGWYWKRLQANNRTTIQIDLSSSTYSAGTAVLAGRILGTTPPRNNPDHNIRFTLNGTDIGDVASNGTTDTTFKINFSASLLVRGNNRLQLRNTITSFNEVLVDYVELRLPSALSVVNGRRRFSISDTLSKYAAVEITGVTDTAIVLAKVFPTESLIPFTIFQQPDQKFKVVFTDTLAPNAVYEIIEHRTYTRTVSIAPYSIQDIVSNAIDKDYLIITHPFFKEAAQRLAAYRASHDKLQSSIIEIDQIFQNYSHGFLDPHAIKQYLQDVYQASTKKPAYLLFLGDASWDYKNRKNLPFRNYVPSYGYPVSDTWFSGFDTLQPYHPFIHTGRLPVASLEEAHKVIDKIISYDGIDYTDWSKRFIIMTAGLSQTEINQFTNEARSIISSFITPPPLGAEGIHITNTLGNELDMSFASETRKRFDDGSVWITYMGHGATTTWSNGISSPTQMRNTLGWPTYLTDFGCSSGRFAEPDIPCLGEDFLFDQQGAVNYMGMSGFGFTTALSILRNSSYRAVVQDTLRRFGEIIDRAKLYMRQAYGLGSTNAILRQTLGQYVVIGDPAQKIRVSGSPELSIPPSLIKIEPEQPTNSDDSLKTSFILRNDGLTHPDSVLIRVKREFRDSSDQVSFWVPVPMQRSSHTASFPIKDLTGEHSIEFSIIPNASDQDGNLANNTVTINQIVFTNSVTIVQPLPYQALDPASIRLEVLNPMVAPAENYHIDFEIDTVRSFDSPFKRLYTRSPEALVTSLDLTSTGLSSGHYYWRARTRTSAQIGFWSNGEFSLAGGLARTWAQMNDRSFSTVEMLNAKIVNGVRINRKRVAVEVVSAGHCNGETAQLRLDGLDLLWNIAQDGHNIVIIDQHSGNVLDYYPTGMSYSPNWLLRQQKADSIISLYPDSVYVIVTIKNDGAFLGAPLISAFQKVGSTQVGTIKLWDSYVLIGRKGASPGQAKEFFKRALPLVVAPDGVWWCNPDTPDSLLTPLVVQDTIQLYTLKGSVASPMIGPAVRWDSLFVDVDTTQPGTSFALDLIRIKETGQSDTLYNVKLGNHSLFAGIDAREYPYIRLLGQLSDDDGHHSPVLKSWSVSFASPPDIMVAPSLIRVTALNDTLIAVSTVEEGENVSVRYSMLNAGATKVDSGYILMDYIQALKSARVDSVSINGMSGGAALQRRAQFNTTGFRGEGRFAVTAKLINPLRELRTFNNTASVPFVIRRDTIPPTIQVLFNGTAIRHGDYISSRPEIFISLQDASPMAITDPGNVTLKLNNHMVTFANQPDSLFEPFSNPTKVHLTYKPHLADGDYDLVFTAQDASGNIIETPYEISFKVLNNFQLINVFNFPNPFSSTTAFTFFLSGQEIPDRTTIKVYTINGRRIRTIEVYSHLLKFGFNTIFWDGLDDDASEIANGLYFFRISSFMGQREFVHTGKLAKLR